ncbi:MAG: hypothetical protein A2Z94_00920 [Gallionellales bacterium GWA2_55_18]|nr:MAG: hypothetical protein A2Z94_00920 [Gallionellales bacterium GWA2_55_18]
MKSPVYYIIPLAVLLTLAAPIADARPPAAAPAAEPPPAATSGLRVTCEGDDVGAEVTVNGKFKGECPLDMQVPEGVLRLRVEKKYPMYDRVFEQEIRMGDGVMKKVEAVLSRTLNAAGQQRLHEERAQLDAEGMVMIPAGSFEMGASNGDNDEKPVHRVDVKPFAMGKYEVTQKEWREVMGSDPPEFGFKGCDTCPVESVSWNDIQEFIRKLNARTGKQYRLPTEAEWEYACRAGGRHTYCGSDDIDAVAWQIRNSKEKTHPVGQKQANAWGLYDMSGNVWEWVEDSYHDSYNGAPTDGTAWQGDGAKRVLRGGAWFSLSNNARAAIRSRNVPANRYYMYGFRLARTLL